MSQNRLIKRLAVSLLAAYSLNALAAPTIDVHSDPNCGCCSSWVSHLEEAGFDVNHHRDGDLRSIKMANGVPPELASCHTAIVEGYVIEGHVPASDIQQLLEEQPEVVGLTVPGMPHGSPGMETGRVDDYAVLSWTRNDSTSAIFSEYTQ
ncbi:DUF411 domain-containing protein [Halomonas sp. TD01]|uniref:DUF411 domain-containing protein n=1 Tax=Halomonas sp. TD01 TaxID=999141 RepID=UPI000214E0E2|nr:DUF411 domain-containing protein [Halomonas sp. TD01]EGP18851.1 hypothetical protein GME_14715 [Halomonas sp. TD01]CAH1042128.1 CopG protein [Halomonas sp. TD01]